MSEDEKILSQSITITNNATVDCLHKKLMLGSRRYFCPVNGCKLNEGGSCLRPHSQIVMTVEEVEDNE
jgi:hypothetical protein